MPHVFFFLADGRTSISRISARADWLRLFRRGCQSGSIASITLLGAPARVINLFINLFVDAASGDDAWC